MSVLYMLLYVRYTDLPKITRVQDRELEQPGRKKVCFWVSFNMFISGHTAMD